MIEVDAVDATMEQSVVGRCLQEIRRMVVVGELLPGQKVNQGVLAEQLNVSRIPVREALSTLQAEGVLEHKRNTGFTVARFGANDLAEIYLMRRLLETELLRTIDLREVDVDMLAGLNREMASISPAEHPDEYQESNRRFHFGLFDYSTLDLVRKEVSRLWYMSGFYRSLYLHEAEASLHVSDDHDEILDAVRAHDVDKVIAACDRHRGATESLVSERLGRSRPRH